MSYRRRCRRVYVPSLFGDAELPHAALVTMCVLGPPSVVDLLTAVSKWRNQQGLQISKGPDPPRIHFFLSGWAPLQGTEGAEEGESVAMRRVNDASCPSTLAASQRESERENVMRMPAQSEERHDDEKIQHKIHLSCRHTHARASRVGLPAGSASIAIPPARANLPHTHYTPPFTRNPCYPF